MPRPIAIAFGLALATASCGAIIELEPIDEPPPGGPQDNDASSAPEAGADTDVQEQGDDASSTDALARGEASVDTCGTTISGFDTGMDATWSPTQLAGGTVARDTQVKRTGGGSVRMTVPTPNAAAFLEQEFASDCALKSLSAQVHIVEGSTSNVAGRPLIELQTNDGALLELRLTSSSSTFTSNGAGGAMGSGPVPKNAWVAVTIQCFKLASEARCAAKVGANPAVALSLPSFDSIVSEVRIGLLPSPQGAGTVYFDDITIEN